MDSEPIVVDFPLRGEWETEHTPAERVPSHGTDQLGQRFAFDFVRIEKDRSGLKFFRGSMLRYLVFGVSLEQCYGWSERIYSPFAGTVTVARDGWHERKRLHLLRDLAVVIKNAFLFDPRKSDDLRPILGNHIIIKSSDVEAYAFIAHARCGSLMVQQGDLVHSGQPIAQVGHSGNSTAPHLHFHIMDSADILQAAGLPCCFREYEALHDGAWHNVIKGIPGKREFIRYPA